MGKVFSVISPIANSLHLFFDKGGGCKSLFFNIVPSTCRGWGVCITYNNGVIFLVFKLTSVQEKFSLSKKILFPQSVVMGCWNFYGVYMINLQQLNLLNSLLRTFYHLFKEKLAAAKL